MNPTELLKQILEPIKEENKIPYYSKEMQKRLDKLAIDITDWFMGSLNQSIIAVKQPNLTRQFIKQKIAEHLTPEDVYELVAEYIHCSSQRRIGEEARNKMKEDFS